MPGHQLPLRLSDDVRLVVGMKVSFFIRDLAVGGSQRQLAVLAAALARRGHDVAVIVLYADGARETAAAFSERTSRFGVCLSPDPDDAGGAAAASTAQDEARLRAARRRRAAG